ncbi:MULTISPECIES: LysR family transcriptional regulator [unclassified Variovorax]|jgi:DNA-binding transcriptional LysR family regulator|uniref:LysR family transcriptional regulator n=1 Tax=unclassified Variovorax TaxID=663243 RepID=UPI000F7D6E97|nr:MULTISPECIES: LysR family transcriptional regulator [unclassified Variovorax]RSZ30918.1 LysR family transcriptional regulator [Variovorax sp. 553]RSZ31500.1 LysR family transcriptional regulator [Variovorax sp. 679]
MDTRQMRCVIAIAEAGSLTKAAERMGLAQPALTQTLNRLEQELGTRLFTRSRRGATLTDAGLAVIDDLRASLAYGDTATERARAMGAGRAGRLTIGFVTHAVYEVLPNALRRLRAEHPQLDVVLREMSNAEQVSALEGGRIDIALLHPPVTVTARVHELRLGEEPLIAALPSSWPLHEDGCVSLADVARHGLVWFPEQQIPALRAQLLGALRRAGHETRVVQDANRTLTVLACVAAGLGWSLLPRSVRALQHEGVRYAEVRDGAGLPAFELSALWLARSRPTFADTFAAMLRG